MPRGMKVPEKTKDFKGTMIRLFKNLDKFRKLLILSLLLAFLSSILSAIAPNKLSDVTNVISDGIKPNVEMFKTISSKMMENVYKNYQIHLPMQSVTDESIPNTDFNQVLANLDLEHKRSLLEEFSIDGVVISVDDQLEYLTILESIDSTKTEEMIAKIDELPKSIKSLVEPKLDMDELKNRSLVLAIIYLLGAIFLYFQGLLMAYVANGYSKGLRSSISHKINKLPLKYFDTHEAGDVLSRVTNDIDTIGMNMDQSLSTLVSQVTLFIGAIIMMFVTNWIMALTAIGASIFGFLFSFMLLKKSQKYFIERQEVLGALNGHIEEIYSGHNVVKAYNGEEEALREFDEINNRLYYCNRKSQFLSGIMHPIMMFIGNFGYVAVCVVGAILVMKDMTSFGTIVAFMIYVRLFTNPLSQIAQAMTSLQSMSAAAERVFEFVDEAELSSEKGLSGYVDPKKAKGNIEFKHVKFAYDEGHPIIKDFSAKVNSGEKIAIVGPTGAGKTTMVNLLMKFYDIESGDILIDGVSIHDMTRENIHNLFIMVLQDTWLFDGTVRDNIRYNQKNVNDEKIWKVCNTVGIDHFIKTLPGGLDSEVGDNEAISSGQKQLLTIARGMMEDAPFLILDEATSNVDTRTEELVQKAMDKLTEGRTSFIIAHRLSTIKNADLILVMNEGNIVEQGKHEDLLKLDGFYAKLYNSQFQK